MNNLNQSQKADQKKLIDGVFQFLSPEEIDKLMISKISLFSRNSKGSKAKPKWTDGEIDIRNAVILDYICRQGLSRTETARQLSVRWECSPRTIERYIYMAIDSLNKDYDEHIDQLRDLHLERLENLLEDCIERNNTDQALKVLDQLAKVNGLYTQKQDVTINDVTTTFKFGN